MEKLKFILILIYNLVRKNLVKSICLISLIVSVFVISFHSFEDSINYKNVVKSDSLLINDLTKYYYIIYDENSSSNFTIEIFDDVQVLDNGDLVEYSSNGTLIFLFVLSVISAIILLLCAFIYDDETTWDYKEILTESYLKIVKLSEQDGFYYYTLNNRLLMKTDKCNRSNSYDVESLIKNLYIPNKNLLPIWYSISDKRSNKLSKIGI